MVYTETQYKIFDTPAKTLQPLGRLLLSKSAQASVEEQILSLQALTMLACELFSEKSFP